MKDLRSPARASTSPPAFSPSLGVLSRGRIAALGSRPRQESAPPGANFPVRPIPSSAHICAKVSESVTLPQARVPSGVRQTTIPSSGEPSRSKVTVYVSTRTGPVASASTGQRGNASTSGWTSRQAKLPPRPGGREE